MSKESKEYTFEEVALHNKESDMWGVFEGKVLNLTTFLAEHPGGEDVLMEVAGGDLTTSFHDIGHSQSALDLMDDLIVGKIKGGAKVILHFSRTSQHQATQQSSKVKSVVKPQSDSTGYLFPILIIILSVVGYYFFA